MYKRIEEDLEERIQKEKEMRREIEETKLKEQQEKYFKALKQEGKIDSGLDKMEINELDKAKCHYKWGNNAFDEGLYECAIDEFTTAIQFYPSYTEAYTQRSLTYSKLKRHTEAKADMKAAQQHLGKNNSTTKEGQHLNDNAVMFCLMIAVIILAVWVENKFTGKQDNVKIISKEYQSPSIQLPHPPDIQNDSDMRRDIYDASRRAIVVNKYSTDSQPYHSQPQSLPGLNYGGWIDDSLTRNRPRDEAKRHIDNDGLMQPHRDSLYNDPVTNVMPKIGGISDNIYKSRIYNHSESHSPKVSRGAINVQTGEVYAPAAGGIIEPKTGTFMPDVGGGYFDSRTGKFIPKTGQ